MKKIITSVKPNPQKFIFSQGINYFSFGRSSIWGRGDKVTLNYLNKVNLKGNWLNVAAGDGRYSNELLKKVDLLTVLDYDPGAISKLWFNTSTNKRKKLKYKVCNIINKLPFKDHSFDGLFCTGILHLFPKNLLQGKLFPEFRRVVKKNGRIIIDFATNITRRYPNKKLHLIYKNEPKYKIEKALRFVNKQFTTQNSLLTSEITEDLTKEKKLGYVFNCNYILLDATVVKL